MNFRTRIGLNLYKSLILGFIAISFILAIIPVNNAGASQVYVKEGTNELCPPAGGPGCILKEVPDVYIDYGNSITIPKNSSSVNININIKPATNGKDYGPINVELASSDGSIKTIKATNSAQGVNLAATIYAEFTDVKSNDYKACIQNTTKCAEFTKESSGNIIGKITIDITDSEYPSIASSTSKSSCNVDGIGWIICPVANFMAKIADGAFSFLSDRFLKTDTQIFTAEINGKNPTFAAWSVMRDIANVAFVIVFLIIIFSQVTSFGISNYGIKKMLPKLVIAAILVNISYFVCQIAVDISNIAGYSLKDLLAGLVPDSMAKSAGSGGSPMLTVTIAILGAGAGVAMLWGAFALLLPVLLAAVLALVMILFILVARQAIIVLLIVISPLAFVAYLLPNTASLFDKWKKTFTAMLMIFPVIAVVFGASTMASIILGNVFAKSEGADAWIGQMISAMALVVPLFIVPGLLKKSLDAIPMLGQMASGLSSRANGNLGSKLSTAYKNGDFAKGMEARKQLKEKFNNREYARRLGRSGISNVLSGGIPLPTEKSRYVRAQMASASLSAADKADQEDVKAESILLKSLRPTMEQNRQLALGGNMPNYNASASIAKQAAAMDAVIASNDIEGINSLWNESKNWSGEKGDQLRAKLADSLQSASGKPAYIGGGAIAGLRQNQHSDITETIKKAIEANTYSASKIALADGDELAEVTKVAFAADSAVSESARNILAANAKIATDTPSLAVQISKNISQVNSIAQGKVYDPSNPAQGSKNNSNKETYDTDGNTVTDSGIIIPRSDRK